METKFAELFAGDDSKYIEVTYNGGLDERGKRKADYNTVHKPLTTELWKQHLNGECVLGLRPERGEECKWGCIDIDPKDYKGFNQKKIVDIIKNAKLPLVACRSKSGGLHLFLFLKDWTPIDKLKKTLDEWNNTYFLSKEVFPANKAVGMPYTNYKATMEYGYNEDNIALSPDKFIEYALSKRIDIDEFKHESNFEIEDQWSQYPPCVQNLINEKWSGDNRNNFLFNILVLERKKNETISVEELQATAIQRNKEVFTRPLPNNEVINLAKSIMKGQYFYKCPPKHNELMPICNKELCKNRDLGIKQEAPAIIDDFQKVKFIKDVKHAYYEFEYQGKFLQLTPEDLKDEKSFRVKLLYQGIFWKTLTRQKNSPPPFEILMDALIKKAEHVTDLEEHNLDDLRYTTLKEFFEDTIEVDDFNKLKDGFVVLETKTNICYFKQITLDKWLASKKKTFDNTREALRLLNADRKEYYEGTKNVWAVKMPEFVDYQVPTKKKQQQEQVSEMDDEYHTGKFRT